MLTEHVEHSRVVVVVVVSEPLESRIQLSFVPIQSGSVAVQGCIKFAPVQTEQALDAQIMLDKALVEAGMELAEPVRQRCVLSVARIGQVSEPAREVISVRSELTDRIF